MTQTLQTQLEDARDSFSAAVEDTFEVIGQAFAEDGFGDANKTVTNGATASGVNWLFKYENQAVEFVRARYTYEVEQYGLDRFYNVELQGVEEKERDVFVVSKYYPPNVWNVRHVAASIFEAIDEVLSELIYFTEFDSKEGVFEEYPELEERIEYLEAEFDLFTDTIQTVQDNMEIEDLVLGIQEGYEELCTVGICDDPEDKDSVWKVFNCYKNGEVEPTEPTIHFTNDEIALVTVEQWYDGEPYTIAYVVGVDDGDTPFFIHRLQDSDEVEEHTGEWTEEEVYNIMGFDKNLDENGEIEYGVRYRVQGDTSFVRRRLQDEVEDVTTRYAKIVVNDLVEEYAEDFLKQQDGGEYLTLSGSLYYVRLNPDATANTALFDWKEEYDTSTMKTIQEELNISEEQVREEQDERGWSRLSQNRRREIVRSLLEQRCYYWVQENYNIPVEEKWEQAVQEQREVYEDVAESCPITLGNHLIVVANATIHPDSNRRLAEDIEVVVPEETQMYFIHDEHNSVIVRIPKGIYEFGFLDQHFNA